MHAPAPRPALPLTCHMQTPDNDIGDEGVGALLKALPGCSKLVHMQLKCTLHTLSPHSLCTRHSPATPFGTATGNSFTIAGYTALITVAVNAAKACAAFGWVADIAHMIPASSLKTASLPVELEGNTAGILAYLRHIHKGGRRHATLVVVGPSGVGKSSLLWRLQHPTKDEALEEQPPSRGANAGMLVS